MLGLSVDRKKDKEKGQLGLLVGVSSCMLQISNYRQQDMVEVAAVN